MRGLCSNMAAELQDGMMAWDEGFRSLDCEVDALLAPHLINPY